jgi:hypothetical protein
MALKMTEFINKILKSEPKKKLIVIEKDRLQLIELVKKYPELYPLLNGVLL